MCGLAWLSHIYLLALWPGLPIDFSNFWGAAQRVVAGDAALVYNGQANDRFLGDLHKTDAPDGLNFPYPPGLLLLLWPLAFFSFPVAWAIFLLPGMIAFFWIAKRLTDPVTALGMTFAFGGPIHAIQLGQNGFLTASLIAGGLLALPRNKMLAGIAVGILTLKPHLSVVAILALIVWREWRALTWALATAGALSALATLVFGPDIWLAFLSGNTSFLETITAKQHTLIEPMQQSVIALTIGSLGTELALAMQAVTALLALLVCFRVRDQKLAIAAVIAATLLVAPFSFLYDSSMLFLACAILIDKRRGLSLPLAVIVGLTGFWLLTLTPLVPFAAIAILLMAWWEDVKLQGREHVASAPAVQNSPLS